MDLKIDSIKFFLGEAKRSLGFSVDLLSFDRNSWFALARGQVGAGYNVFTAFSGVLMSISATLLIKRTFEEMAKAFEENDPRTLFFHTFTSLPSAASFAAVAYGMTISKVASLAGALGVASSAASIVPVAATAMSAANLMAGSYKEYTTGKLKDSLDKILLEGAEGENSNPIIAADQRRKAAINMVLGLIHVSPREFERQTSPEHLAEVLKLIGGKSVETLDAKTQKEILRTVYEVNYRANLKGRLLIAVSIIGLIACITGFILTGGVAAAVVFIIGSLVWMALDSPEISKRIGDWFWANRRSTILPADLQEKEDEAPANEMEFLGKNALAILLSPLWMIPSMLYLEGEAIYDRINSSPEDDFSFLKDSDFTDGKFRW